MEYVIRPSFDVEGYEYTTSSEWEGMAFDDRAQAERNLERHGWSRWFDDGVWAKAGRPRRCGSVTVSDLEYVKVIARKED